MLAANLLQTGSNSMWWLWILLIVLIIALVIWWWWSRRKSVQVDTRPASPVQARAETAPDDLTRIEGIGPKVAKVLNEAGIRTFAALAAANPSEVQQKLKAAGLQMMNPEGWIEQAALAAKGDWAALERLQGELKGGRR
jgi:LPXTG-motif cell wall-anchored protein